MPEIAEVETVKRTLKKMVLNKEIINVNIIYPKIIESDITDFQNILKGRKIIDIKRIGKWLIFDLDDYALLSHLRMEGKYFVKNSNDSVIKHEHIIISFLDGTDLRYHDIRKFGRMNLVRKEEVMSTPAIARQGIEPIGNALTKEYLYSKIHNKNIPIKTLLLDQSIISGLGNIYANEVLFASTINPHRLGREISIDECEKIVSSSKDIIKRAIEQGGTTIKSYTSSLGVTGKFQQSLQVHKRESFPCFKCHNLIVKEKIGGRSTYYCKTCQK